MPKEKRTYSSHYSSQSRDRERERGDHPDSSSYRDYDRRSSQYYPSSSRQFYSPQPYPSPHMSDPKRKGYSRGRGHSEYQQRGEMPREGPGRSSSTSSSGGGDTGRSRGPRRGVDPQGAWGRRPGPPQETSSSYSESQESDASRRFKSVTRAHMGRSEDTEGKGEVSKPGSSDLSTLGRGGVRGRRVLPAELLLTRPKELQTKKGVMGQPVVLQANYFKLLSYTNWCLYQYRVDFAPEEDRAVVRKGLLRVHAETLGAYIFDGSVLYTSHKYADTLQLVSERQSDNEKIMITVTFVGEMARGDFHYLQFFNIVMRKCLDYLQLQLVGRNYFDARNKIEIRQYKLELWPGYITSIRQHERDILMCAEITHKVMRQQTLLDIFDDVYNRNERDYMNIYCTQVIGLVVLTDYNNNTYRIDDVDFDVTPLSQFKMRTGEMVTYKDYYKNKYNIIIRHDSQPMLVSRVKPRDRRSDQEELAYLVPELCRTTGLSERMRTDFNLMRSLATHTRVAPARRIDMLLGFNRRLQNCDKVCQEFKKWGLELDQKLIELPARVLPFEKIYFGNGATTTTGDLADWTKDLRESAMYSQYPLSDWICIVPAKADFKAQAFVSTLIKAAATMKYAISQPYYIKIQDDRAPVITHTIEETLQRNNPQLLFCIVTNNRSDRYSAIKKKCAVDRPIPTQVCVLKTVEKNNMSIATKIAIQLNCKIGGAPWAVEVPLSGVMIVGFDVCHDTKSKGTDFGAMVASLDKNCSRYFSAVSQHSNGEELSNNLSLHIIKALNKFQECNSNLPQRIIIYRDGVGEGQIPYVFEHEITHVKKKLMELYPKPEDVRLAFILVTKRINTRLFFNSQNPPPGTVVDDVITNPVKYDFFIVSQKVNQGTVTPTAYSVLHNTTGLDADKLQRLTYKLTHMYYNWCGTVRVPAPCQYAHKLAFLVSQAIHRPPSNYLDTVLHFL